MKCDELIYKLLKNIQYIMDNGNKYQSQPHLRTHLLVSSSWWIFLCSWRLWALHADILKTETARKICYMHPILLSSDVSAHPLLLLSPLFLLVTVSHLSLWLLWLRSTMIDNDTLLIGSTCTDLIANKYWLCLGGVTVSPDLLPTMNTAKMWVFIQVGFWIPT